MTKYKNSGPTIDLIGIGTVEANAEFETDQQVIHPQIEAITTDQSAPSIVGTEAPQPNAVVDAQPVAAAPINPVVPTPTQGGTN